MGLRCPRICKCGLSTDVEVWTTRSGTALSTCPRIETGGSTKSDSIVAILSSPDTGRPPEPLIYIGVAHPAT